MNLNQLKDKLTAEGFNPDFYCIGPNWSGLSDGYALDKVGEQYQFFYVERGSRDDKPIETFNDQAIACDFAYNYLSNISYIKNFCVAVYIDAQKAESLRQKLEEQGCKTFIDTIPYAGVGNLGYRVFIVGKGIEIAKNLLPKIPYQD